MDAHKEFRRGIDYEGNRREGWIKVDWGFTRMISTELQALRMAYSYKDHPHGCEIKGTEKGYHFTLFNEAGGKMFNGRK